MTALAYTAAIQTRINSILGINLTTADTFTKTLIDGTWTSGAPGGMALDALTQIQQIGQWMMLDIPANVPAEWESWLVAKTALMAGVQIHPNRVQQYEEMHARAEMAALDFFARNLITYDTGGTPEASVLTTQNIRYYVVGHLIRREPGWETVDGSHRQKPRKAIPFEIIDANIERVMRQIWQYGDWPFARRLCTFSITTANAVTITGLGAGEIFASLTSRKLYFDDVASQGANFMEWFKDPDDMSRRKAYDVNSNVTGRPRYFNYSDSSGTLTWTFHPALDQTYTAKGVVLIKGPTLDTLSKTTTALARFPAEFNHIIKDAVLAETLRHIGDRDGVLLWQQVTEELERMLPVYCAPGPPSENSLEMRDAYNDLASFTGGTSTLGGWM